MLRGIAAHFENSNGASTDVKGRHGKLLSQADAILVIKELKVKGLVLKTCFLKKA